MISVYNKYCVRRERKRHTHDGREEPINEKFANGSRMAELFEGHRLTFFMESGT